MSHNNWSDIAVLEAYLDGKLEPKAMHEVERLSLEDPFVAEALEGLSYTPQRMQTLSLLQKQLQERIAEKPAAQKRWRLTSHRLSIASAAAVLFITVSIFFWMRETRNVQPDAAPVEAVIAQEKPALPPVSDNPKRDEIMQATQADVYARNKPRSVAKPAQKAQPEAAPTVANDNSKETVEVPPPGALSLRAAAPEKTEQARLNEVTITAAGFSRTKKAITTAADTALFPSGIKITDRPAQIAPENGWSAFARYLQSASHLFNANKAIGKTAQLTFTIAENGKPANITVKAVGEHTLSAAETLELIRLLNEGPIWRLASGTAAPTQRIGFSLSF